MSIMEKGNDPPEISSCTGIGQQPAVLSENVPLKAQLTEFTVQNVLDAVVWLDRSGNIFYVNDAACRMVGYSEEELLSMTVFDINPVMSRPQWESQWTSKQTEGASSMKAKAGVRMGRYAL